MRISDWSSDVCSSDLAPRDHPRRTKGESGRDFVRMSERIDRARSSASKFAEVIAPLDEVDFLYSPIDQTRAKFSLADRQIPVHVALAATARERLDTLRNVPVPTRNGGTVPLSVVAEIDFGAGPTQINRTNQVRQLTMGADLAPGLVTGQAMQKVEQLAALKQLPVGVTRLVLGSATWRPEEHTSEP